MCMAFIVMLKCILLREIVYMCVFKARAAAARPTHTKKADNLLCFPYNFVAIFGSYQNQYKRFNRYYRIY